MHASHVMLYLLQLPIQNC